MFQLTDRAKSLVEGSIPSNSPLFSIYSGRSNLLEFLNIPNVGIEVVDFSEALRVFRDIEGWKNEDMSRRARIRDSAFISHVINRSGYRRDSQEGVEDINDTDGSFSYDMRYPPTTLSVLFPLARENLSNDEEGKKSWNGRLPIVFYDSITGDLILRNFSEEKQPYGPKGVKLRVMQAASYLGVTDIGFNQTTSLIRYLSGILEDRFDYIMDLRNGEPLHVFEEERGVKNNRAGQVLDKKDIKLKSRTRLRNKLRQISGPLGITPVYLVYPPAIREEEDDENLANHIRRTYSH